MDKVLILINNDVGLYKFRKELIEELLIDHEVFISLPKGSFVKELIDMGCQFIDTEINRRGTNPITDFKLIMDYRRIIKQIQPDIILTYTIKPNIYGNIMARLYKTPYLPTITGVGTAIKKKGPLQKLVMSMYQVSLQNAKTVFFQNTENLDLFLENNIVSNKQIKLVPGSGVNLNHHNYQNYPNEENEINFIFIGRLMTEKGILELFDAAKYFEKAETKIKFHVLGFMEENLEDRMNDLIKKDLIVYHGQQSDIRPFLKDAHAIIHPSYHEGLSNVLLEAAASGRPILASDIPGCRETFEEGVTGLGFKPQSAESLIETIGKFIKIPHQEKEKMGILGRKKIEKEFNREQVVESYINEIK